MPLSDEMLLLNFIDRNERAALAELFERYQTPAYALARHAGLSASDAEDAAQTAFMELILSARSFRRDARFAPWFFRIVVNAALKKRGLDRRREFLEESTELPMETAHEPDPHAAAVHAETLRLLDESLCALPEKLRLPIVLRYRLSLDSAQAAQALGCGENTFRTWLKRGLDELRTNFAARSGMASADAALCGMLALLPLTPAPATLSASVLAAAGAAKIAPAGSLNNFARTLLYIKAHPIAVIAASIGFALAANFWMPTFAGPGSRPGVSTSPSPRDTAGGESKQPEKEHTMDQKPSHTLLAAAFCKKLGTLLTSGVPPATAIKLLESETADAELQPAIHAMALGLDGGSTLGAMMRNYPDFFPEPVAAACAKPLADLDLQLLVTGEMLDAAARFQKKDDAAWERTRRSYQFVRAFALTTRLGFSLVRGLNAIADSGCDPVVISCASGLSAEVGAGGVLSAAMARQTAVFQDTDVAMMAAAEQTGTVDVALTEIADLLERDLRASARYDEKYQQTRHVGAILYSLGSRLSGKNLRVDTALEQTAKYITAEPYHTALVNGLAAAPRVNGDVELSTVFAANSKVFGPAAAHIARAGEAGNVLSIVLMRLARQYFDEASLNATRMDGTTPPLEARRGKSEEKQKGDF